MLPGSSLPRKNRPHPFPSILSRTSRESHGPVVYQDLSLRVKWFPKARLGQNRLRELLGRGK